MNLEQTAAALSEQFPGGKAAEIERAEQRLERFGQIAFGGLGIIVVLAILGMIYFIFTKMILGGTQPLAGVALILFLIFAAMSLAYVVFREDLNEKRKAARPSAATPPEIAHSTNELLTEGTQMPIDSVVEDTTDLLQVENLTRKLDK